MQVIHKNIFNNQGFQPTIKKRSNDFFYLGNHQPEEG